MSQNILSLKYSFYTGWYHKVVKGSSKKRKTFQFSRSAVKEDRQYYTQAGDWLTEIKSSVTKLKVL